MTWGSNEDDFQMFWQYHSQRYHFMYLKYKISQVFLRGSQNTWLELQILTRISQRCVFLISLNYLSSWGKKTKNTTITFPLKLFWQNKLVVYKCNFKETWLVWKEAQTFCYWTQMSSSYRTEVSNDLKQEWPLSSLEAAFIAVSPDQPDACYWSSTSFTLSSSQSSQ